jgi:hypothetical protein
MTQQIKDNVSVQGDLDAQHLIARQYAQIGAGQIKILSGKGVPAATLGGIGYLYLRNDGGGAGATHIYFKSGVATWIGLA